MITTILILASFTNTISYKYEAKCDNLYMTDEISFKKYCSDKTIEKIYNLKK